MDVVQYLVEELGVDVNKATNEASGSVTPLHIAVQQDHVDVAVCLMERGMADLNARTRDGHRPMDLAISEEMREAIVNEEKRRRDHGFKRTVIPSNPTAEESESNENEGGEEEGTANTVTNEEETEENDDDEEDSDSSDDEDKN
jgi:ankyrin repeat protein